MKIKFNNILFYFLSCFSIIFLLLGTFSLKNELSLNNNVKIIEAEVVNWRTSIDYTRSKGIGPPLYEIQYVFSLPNNSVKNTREDFMGRKNLWSRLPEKTWNETKVTKKIMIIYDSTKPWNNQIQGQSGFGDTYAALILGLLVGVICIWLFFNSKCSRK